MKRSQAGPVGRPGADTGAPQGLELRHLRYFAAVAGAGTFTRAAEQLFIAQPTLSQQIRQLEQLIGAPLLARGRDGVQLTAAGAVLLTAARDVLSRTGHGVSQARQAAGLGRPRLRVALPPGLPDSLAVPAACGLRSAASTAGVALTWLDTPLDAEFSAVREHRADAALGWLTTPPGTLPAPLDAMTLGQFEPEVWIPRAHPAARREMISLAELAGLDVLHGPRPASPATYDRWRAILRAAGPRFEFTDPPLPNRLPMTLVVAATAAPPAAVLTGPVAITGLPPGVTRLPRPPGAGQMARVSIEGQPLTATAALIWNGDLPRPLQQILFDTADRATPPAPAPLPRAS